MNDENDSKLGRRQALQLLGLGVSAAGVLIAAPALAGAPPKAAAPKAPAAPLSCNDKAPIDETSKTMRTALQYKEKADAPEKKCSGCAQFEAKKFGDCGGCKLFTGAISPEGSCLSFAPLAPAK
jgi:High potential iron-sulfur protein